MWKLHKKNLELFKSSQFIWLRMLIGWIGVFENGLIGVPMIHILDDAMKEWQMAYKLVPEFIVIVILMLSKPFIEKWVKELTMIAITIAIINSVLWITIHNTEVMVAMMLSLLALDNTTGEIWRIMTSNKLSELTENGKFGDTDSTDTLMSRVAFVSGVLIGGYCSEYFAYIQIVVALVTFYLYIKIKVRV